MRSDASEPVPSIYQQLSSLALGGARLHPRVTRQYVHLTLHDRIVTRPFLSLCEKKWLTFQANFPLFWQTSCLALQVALRHVTRHMRALPAAAHRACPVPRPGRLPRRHQVRNSHPQPLTCLRQLSRPPWGLWSAPTSRAPDGCDPCAPVRCNRRAENCLVTPLGWLLLTDFSPFKPAQLPVRAPLWISPARKRTALPMPFYGRSLACACARSAARRSHRRTTRRTIRSSTTRGATGAATSRLSASTRARPGAAPIPHVRTAFASSFLAPAPAVNDSERR